MNNNNQIGGKYNFCFTEEDATDKYNVIYKNHKCILNNDYQNSIEAFAKLGRSDVSNFLINIGYFEEGELESRRENKIFKKIGPGNWVVQKKNIKSGELIKYIFEEKRIWIYYKDILKKYFDMPLPNLLGNDNFIYLKDLVNSDADYKNVLGGKEFNYQYPTWFVGIYNQYYIEINVYQEPRLENVCFIYLNYISIICNYWNKVFQYKYPILPTFGDYTKALTDLNMFLNYYRIKKELFERFRFGQNLTRIKNELKTLNINSILSTVENFLRSLSDSERDSSDSKKIGKLHSEVNEISRTLGLL